jgi:hypothetical protein
LKLFLASQYGYKTLQVVFCAVKSKMKIQGLESIADSQVSLFLSNKKKNYLPKKAFIFSVSNVLDFLT